MQITSGIDAGDWVAVNHVPIFTYLNIWPEHWTRFLVLTHYRSILSFCSFAYQLLSYYQGKFLMSAVDLCWLTQLLSQLVVWRSLKDTMQKIDNATECCPFQLIDFLFQFAHLNVHGFFSQIFDVVQLNFADLHFLCPSLCKWHQDAKFLQCYCRLLFHLLDSFFLFSHLYIKCFRSIQ